MSGQCLGYFDAGTPTIGLWCDKCALPSRVEFDLLLVTEESVSVQGRGSVCMKCEQQ